MCEAKPPEQTTVRVVTVSWRPLSAIAVGQTYPEELASAFQGRLAIVQGR